MGDAEVVWVCSQESLDLVLGMKMVIRLDCVEDEEGRCLTGCVCVCLGQ